MFWLVCDRPITTNDMRQKIKSVLFMVLTRFATLLNELVVDYCSNFEKKSELEEVLRDKF